MGFRRRVGGKLNLGLRNQWTRDQKFLLVLRISQKHTTNLAKRSECINKFGDFRVGVKLRLSWAENFRIERGTLFRSKQQCRIVYDFQRFYEYWLRLVGSEGNHNTENSSWKSVFTCELQHTNGLLFQKSNHSEQTEFVVSFATDISKIKSSFKALLYITSTWLLLLHYNTVSKAVVVIKIL